MNTECVFSLEDTAKARELKRRGFIVEPFLGQDDVQGLRDLHRSTFPEVDGDLHLTALLHDPPMKKRLFEAVQNIVSEKLTTLVPGYSLVYASFVTKKAKGTWGRLGMHQDLSLVEHDKHVGLNAWIPLTDVDHTNSCMKLIAGSHAFGHIEANPKNPAPYDKVHKMLDDYIIEVPMKQGEALLFDTQVLHGTDVNTTDKTRIALLLNFHPSCASPKYYQWNKDNPDQLELYEVNRSFFQKFSPNRYGTDVEAHGAKLIGLVDYKFEWTRAEDLPSILPTAHLPKKTHPAPVAAARAESAPNGLTQRCGQLAPEVKSQTNKLPLRKVLSSLLRRG